MIEMGMRMRKRSEMIVTFLARASRGCWRETDLERKIITGAGGTIMRPSDQKPKTGRLGSRPSGWRLLTVLGLWQKGRV